MSEPTSNVSGVGLRAGGRAKRSTRRNAVVLLAVAAATVLVAWPRLAAAFGPGAQGLSPVVESNVTVKGPIRVNVKHDARVITTHITVAPGGHTAWHYHPGPHFVSVRSGTAVVYETDCSVRGVFPAGTGFFDAGTTRPGAQTSRDVHTLRNPSSTETAEVIITDIREDDRPPTVVVDPQPHPCFP